MTKKEKFEVIANIAEVKANEELSAFIAHEIELLSRKRSKSSKPTKTQIENEGIKTRIAEVLTDEGQTVTEIIKALDADYTNQKISALLRQMGARKEVIKGKSYFFAG